MSLNHSMHNGDESRSILLTLPGIFGDVASKHPGNIAIQFEDGDDVWTYAQVNEAATKMAADLASTVPFGQFVPVLLPRCPAQIIAVLAIAKLGAVYVPISIELPTARIHALLGSLPSGVSICLPQHQALLPNDYERVTIVDTCRPALQLDFAAVVKHSTLEYNPRRQVASDDLAAILFTSGSTGVSKGVKLTHGNLCLPMLFIVDLENITPSSSLFQFSSCSFDVHLEDILCALFSGAKLLLVSQEKMMTDLVHWIQKLEPTCIHLTPSVISTLNPTQVPSVKILGSLGEPITREIIDTWADHVALFNKYGLCEASTILAKQLSRGDTPTTLGRPSPYCTVAVVDGEGQTQPVDVPGELVVKGPIVTGGYLNVDGSSKFLASIQDGCDSLPGPWYTTGDQAYIDAQQEFHVVGRVDDQVKINGQLIELRDIESAIKPHVATTTVIAHKVNGRSRLFALVSPRMSLDSPVDDETEIENDSEPLRESVLDACRAALPTYTIPRVVVVESIPRSANGKVDGNKIHTFLDFMLQTEAVSEKHQSTGTGDDQIISQLATIVSYSLKRLPQNVPPQDNLFEWGLTSLDAMLLIREIHEVLGFRLSFQDILDGPTMESIAHLIRNGPAERFAAGLDPYPNNNLERFEDESSVFSPTAAQESLYNATRVFGSQKYICYLAYVVSSSLDASLFLRCVQAIFARHECFNTTFVDDHGDVDASSIAARVHHGNFFSNSTLFVSYEAAKNKFGPPDPQGVMFQAFEFELSDLDHDVALDSPARCTLYQTNASGDSWLVVFRFHHLAIDEYSFSLLWPEVRNMYATGLSGPLPPAPMQYSNYARLQRERMHARREADMKWWASRASGYSGASIASAVLRRSPAGTASSASKISWHPFRPRIAARFLDKTPSSSPFGSWLALSQVFLAKLFGSMEFIIGVPTSTRSTDPRFADVMGYCLTVAVVPVTVNLQQPWAAFQKQAVRNYWDCVAHDQRIEDVLRCFSSAGDGEHAGIEIMFVYHDRTDERMTSSQEPFSYKRMEIPSTASHYDLIIHIDDSGAEQVRLGLEYRTELYSTSFVGDLANTYMDLVTSLADQGESTPLKELSVCSPGAVQRAMNFATTAPGPVLNSLRSRHSDLSIPEVIERIAITQPNSIAIVTANNGITYGQLWSLSCVRAQSLSAAGLSADKVAALFMEKSIEYICSMLAIMMSGASFVCLDTTQPIAIQQAKLDVLKPAFILTHDKTHALATQFSLSDTRQFKIPELVVPRQSNIVGTRLESQSLTVARIDGTTDAYVGFTSGSTSASKCFRIPHYALSAAILGQVEALGVRRGDRVAMLANVAFDVSLMEIFVSLVAGTTLAIAPHNSSVSSLAPALNALGVTVAIATPSVLAMIGSPTEVPGLRSIIIVREPATASLYDLWWDKVEMRVSYGPAEATIATHTQLLAQKPNTRLRGICIGRPSPAVRSYVLDQNDQLCLPGCIGRLVIAAHSDAKYDQLLREYISPTSANSRILQHSRLGRIFDTGDTACYDENGLFYLLGRADDEVMMNGTRFNISDVERVIDGHLAPSQKHSAVLVYPNPGGAKSLACFIEVTDHEGDALQLQVEGEASLVLQLDSTLCKSVRSLRDRVGESLSSSMIPLYWIPLRRMPQTSNGKVNRELLKAYCEALFAATSLEIFSTLSAPAYPRPEATPNSNPAAAPAAEMKPRSGKGRPIGPGIDHDHDARLSSCLEQCWRDVLSIDTPDLEWNRSFFKSGGDSVSAIRFCAKTRSKGISGCTVPKMYAHPSLNGLMSVLQFQSPSNAQKDVHSPVHLSTQTSNVSPPSLSSSSDSGDQPSTEPCKRLTSGDCRDAGSSLSARKFSNEPRPCAGLSIYEFITLHLPQLRIDAIRNALNDAGLVEARVATLYPPTAMQTSMILQCSLNHETYSSQMILHFERSLDISRLRAAWEKVCDSHPSLRTLYIQLEGGSSTPYVAVELKPGALRPTFEMTDMPLLSDREFEDLLAVERKKGFKTDSSMHRSIMIPGCERITMVFTCHHAIFDGWSMKKLLADVESAYIGLALTQGPSVSTFVRDQLSKDKSRAHKFWASYLKDAEMPSLTPPPPSSTGVRAGSSHSIERIDGEFSNALPSQTLQRAAMDLNVTPFTVFTAALGLALAKNRDLAARAAFWVTTSGRDGLSDDIDAIGNYLNSIPYVVDHRSGESSVGEWLAQTQASFVMSSAYDFLPASDVLKHFANKSEEDAGAINALLVFENHAGMITGKPTGSQQGLGLLSMDSREFSDLPLTVVVEPGTTNTKVILKYRNDLIACGSARRLLGRLMCIAADLVSASTRPGVVRVAELGQGYEYPEKSRALELSANYGAQKASSETLISLFKTAAQRFPHSNALISASSEITFSELDKLSDQVAAKIFRFTRGKPATAALYLTKRPAMVIAMLGVFKAGAAYCPLEYEAPPARLDLFIRKANASVIISDDIGFAKMGPEPCRGLHALSLDQSLLSDSPPEALPSIRPEDACYTMFTSGTTGEPKACVLTHGAVASSIKAIMRLYRLDPQSRVLLVANYVFDASVTDIFGSIASGASLALVPDDDIKTSLANCVDNLRINWIHITPTMLKTLPAERTVPTLRTMILGGELMSRDLIERWSTRLHLVCAYGPTEAAVQVLTFSPGLLQFPGDISYDVVPGNLVVVVNADNEIALVGEPGEILISGHQLFSGYYGNLRATEQCLTALPEFKGRRFYRTGDLGQYTADMRIQIFGRQDYQMKLSGMRIDPTEIEDVINSDPVIMQSAVFVYHGRLHALIQGREGGILIDRERLASRCRAALPDRLVPILTQVDEIPTLPSMKINRKALSGILDDINRLGRDPSAVPSTGLSNREAEVAELVGELTGSPPTGPTTPLQRVGLDSLGFMQLRGCLSQRYGVKASYREVRNASTLRGIASLLSSGAVPSDGVKRTWSQVSRPTTSTHLVESAAALPSELTIWVAQERLRDDRYNVHHVLELQNISGNALLSSLVKVANGLAIFKTTFDFDRVNRQLRRVIHPESLFDLQYTSLPNEQTTHALDPIRAVIAKDAGRIFDLQAGPLASFHVFATSTHSYLWTNIHHVLVDAFTTGKFIELLQKAASGCNVGCDLSSMASVAPVERENNGEKESQAWARMLRGAIPFHIPGRKSHAAKPDHRSHTRTLRNTTAIDESDLFQHLLSLFQGLMHRYIASGDLLITIPVSSRGLDGTSAIALGNMTNTALIRTLLHSNDTFQSFMEKTRQGIDFALDNNMSIESVCSASGLNLAEHSVQFTLHDARFGKLQGVVDRTEDVVPAQKPMFDLEWHVVMHSDSLRVMAYFDNNRHPEEMVKIALDGFERLLCHKPGQLLAGHFIEKLDAAATFDWASISASATQTNPLTDGHTTIDSSDEDDTVTSSTPSCGTTVHTELSVKTASDQVQKVLHKALCTILNLSVIDSDQNLRELGLDSFGSMALISLTYQSLPTLELTIHDIMTYPTLRSLVNHLTEDSGPIGSESPLERVSPATSIQRRFYVLQEELGDSTYSIPNAYRVSGCDVSKVLEVVKYIVQDHSVFRTRFQLEADEVFQFVVDEMCFKFETQDFQSMTQEEARSAMLQMCRLDCDRPFDLHTGPLIRATGFKLPRGLQYLLINIHHVIADEHSLALLVQEVEDRIQGRSSRIREVEENAKWSENAPKVNISWEHLFSSRTLVSIPLKQQAPGAGIGSIRHSIAVDTDPAKWAFTYGSTTFGALLFVLELAITQQFNLNGTTVLIPASCRGPSNRNSYGCFLNTLPVPLDTSDGLDLAGTLRNFNTTFSKIISQAHIPFETILKQMGRKWDEFDTMFVYHDTSKSSSGQFLQPSPELLPKASSNMSAKLPFTFSVTRSVQRNFHYLDICAEFDTARLSEKEAISICHQFERILRYLSTATLQDSLESIGVAIQGNVEGVPPHFHGRPNADIYKEMPADLQILACAQSTPNATAVVFEDQTIVTYAELSVMVADITSFVESCALSSGGVEDTRVCIVGDVSIQRVAAIIAIVNMGAAYVPIDFRNPVDWNLHIIDDCQPSCILFLQQSTADDQSVLGTFEHLRSQLVQSGANCLSLPHQLRGCTRSNPSLTMTNNVTSKETSLAYILYTSGSTGKPKGVKVDHTALRNSLHEHRALYRLAPGKRLLQVAPWTFDVSVMDLFATLSSGATLCIGRRDFILSDIEEAVNTLGITHIATTPTVASVMRPQNVPRIELLAIGGEAMTEAVRNTWASKICLLNVYGPTEATVNVIARQVYEDTPVANIGRPLANVFIYILDDRMCQVAAGATGQLALGGLQVARGYLRVPAHGNPFVNHQRYGYIYLTGDLARFEADGSVTCLGRVDSLVNLRGQRVELGAIEHVIDAELMPGKSVALVAKREYGDCIAAVFSHSTTSRSGGTIRLESLGPHHGLIRRLRRTLQEKLPSYFMPTLWIPLSGLPQNRSEKLDRKGLQNFVKSLTEEQLDAYFFQEGGVSTTTAPIQAIATTSVATPGPGSMEQIVRAAFGKVFGVSRVVDEGTNFFSLSGDSISAIRLCSAIRTSGVRIRAKDLYQNPTVEGLASLLSSRQLRAATEHADVPDGAKVIPFTPIMEWFAESGRANENWFNQSHLIKLSEGVSFAKVEKAWRKILQKHPMLQMRLTKSGNRRVAVTPGCGADHVLVVRGARIQSLDQVSSTAKSLQSGLNLENGPISALGELILGTSETRYCALVAHHMAIDVVSWHIMFSDLDDLLQGADIDNEFVSFRTWSMELAQRSETRTSGPDASSANNHRPHAQSLLDGAYDTLMATNTWASGEFVNVEVDAKILNDVDDLFDVAAVDFIMSGLVIALCKWRHLDTVEFCFETHGRELDNDEMDTTRTVGWFTYIIPILLSAPRESPAARDFVSYVKRTRLEAFDHVDLSLPVQCPREVVTFNYLGQTAQKNSYQNFEIVQADLNSDEDPQNKRISILDFEASVAEGVLHLGVFHSKALHDSESIGSLLRLWVAALQELRVGTTDSSSAVVPRPLLPGFDQDDFEAISTSLAEYGIHAASVEAIAPATDIQIAMMVASLDSSAYMHCYHHSIETDDALDVDRFCAAWSEVLTRHSIFRTVLVPLYGRSIKAVGSDVMQVILQRDAIGPFVVREQPPGCVKAAYGLQLIKVFVYQSSEGRMMMSWVCHHAVLDAWSRSIIIDEVHRHYRGEILPLPELHFKDVAAGMTANSCEHREFWASHLGDAEGSFLSDYSQDQASVKDLPLDRHCEDTYNIQAQDVRNLAASMRTPVSTVYRAAWALTVATYASSNDVIFGTITAGRTSDVEGIEQVVGPCLNNIPTRLQIDWTKSIREFIQYAADVCFETAEYEQLSLRRVCEAAGKASLFNTTILLPLPRSGEATEAPAPWRLKLHSLDEVTDLPILVNFGTDDHGAVVASLRTHGRDFSDIYLSRLLESFGKALEGFLGLVRSRKEVVLRDLHLLGEDHQSHLDSLATGPAYPMTEEWTCWQLLERRSSECPNKVAIEFHKTKKTRSVTYGQLKSWAEFGASKMAAAGVQRRSRIALCLEKCLELVPAMFAILRLDSAYVAIDMESPPARIASIFESINPAAIICSRSNAATLPSTSIPVFEVETLFDTAHQPKPPSLLASLAPPNATLDDPAAVLFTSGSTGTPKGVLMPHRQVAGFGVMMAGAIGYTAADRVFQFARSVFDVSQSDIFGSIFAGATLVMAPQEDAVFRLARTLSETRVSSLNVTPSVAALLRPDELRCLRNLCLAGEQAAQSVVERWAPAVRVVNAYGPTEAVVVSWRRVVRGDDTKCIGKPSIGTKVYLLDEHMRPVPWGARGMIWVAGRQVASGYYGRPEATAAVFRENSFESGVIYNTGDIGAYNASGEILYLGRNDRQVKINGKRVELSEIENVLSSQEIRVSVLQHKDKSAARSQLVAFYSKDVARAGTTEFTWKKPDAQAKQLLEGARRSLPPHMVPTVVLGVSCLPLNANAKVDMARLRQIYESYISSSLESESSETTGTRPFEGQTDTEKRLCGWIRERLGPIPLTPDTELIPRVFDSLSMIGFVSLLRKTYGDAVEPGLLMRNRLLGELAKALDQVQSSAGAQNEECKGEPQPSAHSVDSLVHFSAPSVTASQTSPTNLFTFFGANGLANMHQPLASVLPSFVSVLGINNTQLRDRAHYEDIPSMAADHAAVVRSVQNQGPYYLCGFSFAAHIAHVTAQLLLAEGAAVKLILIDSTATKRHPLPKKITDHDLETQFFLPPKEKTSSNSDSRQLWDVLAEQTRRNLRLLYRHRPTRIQADTLLIKRCEGGGNGSHAPGCSEANGYEDFIDGELTVACVPASDHFTMLVENACLEGMGSAIGEFMRKT